MVTDEFLGQFWPQFWGSVAATFFLALITFVFTYLARLPIARFLRKTLENVKHTVIAEEEKLKSEYTKKEL